MSGLVVAALSGGVDSACAAALLVEQGHRVVGMTMRLYDARGTSASSGRCCGPRDIEDARAVCAHLDIPHYVVDLSSEFGAAVVDDFVEAYLAGETPNPCVKCNQHIKFTPLLARARAIGATTLVTGHYAQILADGDAWGLHRGRDAQKDQSYFLFSMPGDELGAVRFPLGGFTKDEVRAHAVRLGLPNAQKAESQEICFVPDGDYAGFVAASAIKRGRALPLAGAIVDHDGTVLGRHDGTHNFTVGQHRGLGNLVVPPDASGKARIPDKRYVTAIDPAKGEVRVGTREGAERRTFALRDLRWLAPPRDAFAAVVQVRHRGQPIAVQATVDGSLVQLELAVPVVAASGQAAVLYAGDRVLAGGWIV
ncbi:MAG: tRNA 2-thiouridine(34) synthase MnmA [Kofleriaceae bacterium]